MTRFLVRPVVALWLACAGITAAGQEQTAEPLANALYADVQAKEKAVRTAFTNTLAAPAVMRAVRTVVADYEDIVGRFPGCGVCDHAIWNAATLSSDAFKRYGESQERDASVRLLRRLALEYPASKLTPRVSTTLAANEAAPPPRPPVKPGGVATISAIRREAVPQAIRVLIEMDGEVQFREERLANPDRVFVDLFGTRLSPAVSDGTLRFDSDALPVRQVRIGRHPNNTTRIVLESAGISTCSVYSLYLPYRLVIECIPEGVVTPPVRAAAPPEQMPSVAEYVAAPSAELAAAPPPEHVTPPPAERLAPLPSRYVTMGSTPIVIVPVVPPVIDPTPLTASAFDAGWGRAFPGVPSNPAPEVVPPPSALAIALPDPSFSTIPRATATTPSTAKPAPPLPAPTAPPANIDGGFSVARQLGLGVSRIVIDPGHGGHDPGAKGNGLTEANIVLDIALRLEKIFETVPGVEVILTRRTDEFVSLEERTAIANRENADLFISIHANGSRNTRAGGVETYFLNFATSQDAAAVAARENATSAQAMAALPEVIKAITLDSKRDESRDFAAIVQRALVKQLRPTNRDLKDLGVKQAPFVVLVGAAMPSVLTEISFVTNAQEARLLRGASYRQRVAQALFEATRTYQTSLKGASAVALQRPGGSGSTEGVGVSRTQP